jgi:hypothetical protein
MAREIAEKVLQKSDPIVQPYLLQSNYSFAYENTAGYLVRHLTRLWGDAVMQNPDLGMGASATTENQQKAQSSPPVLQIAGPDPPSSDTLNTVPPKDDAQRWLKAYLDGPNKLCPICEPAESQQLLLSFYCPEGGINRIAKSLLFFQLAIGAQFTEDTSEDVYSALYQRAWQQMEVCIQKENELLLWIVPLLLLGCLYSVTVQPTSCWLTLGTYNNKLPLLLTDADLMCCV